jgi:eukaryotic-like serine/threonine-protein kinase
LKTNRGGHEETPATGRTPVRVGRLPRGSGPPPLYWAVPLAVAVVIGVAGAFGYRIIRDSFRDDLKSELQTLLDANKEALLIWVDSQRRLAEILVARPPVTEAAIKLTSFAATDADAENSAAVEALSEAVLLELARSGFDGFSLLDPAGKILAANDRSTVGFRLPPQQTALFGQILDGKSRLLPPHALRIATEGATHCCPAAVMFVAAPVRTGPGGVKAVLAFHVPVDRDFTRVLSVARLGDTGETYAFDSDGRLLSESRFEDQLRSAGLLEAGLKSTLNIQIRDPGGNALEGHRSPLSPSERPLTRMAASAVTGARGIDVDGYRDYRGVPVVGAWEWFPELGFGMATEVEVAAAYRPLRLLNLAFWVLFGAAALAALLLSLGSIVLKRLHRTVQDVNKLGQYTLIGKIGEGAMGKVYRASHGMLRRPTAVKLLETREPGAIERFEREVQLTSQLSHPNTIAIYDYGRTPDGFFYYAMEYLDGIDLSDLIKIEGPVPPSRVVHILGKVCGSLAEAHAQGFVHRDIKPSNIMLSMRGGEPDVVKVLDFGLVKRVEPGSEKIKMLTTMGVVFGTPGFIPPETLRDPAVFDVRGDIYALGVLAYELLTGQSLFERTTVYETCRRHLEVDPVPPSLRLGRPVPAKLEGVIMACLAKNPSARPQTIVDLGDLLDSCHEVGPWTKADAREWWLARGPEIEALRTPIERSPGV